MDENIFSNVSPFVVSGAIYCKEQTNNISH